MKSRHDREPEPDTGQPDSPAGMRANGGSDQPSARWASLRGASPALKFVLMVGVMSFFADFTYEGSRSVVGPISGRQRAPCA